MTTQPVNTKPLMEVDDLAKRYRVWGGGYFCTK